MNILVIGSKGFIGSHCLDYFRQAEHNVSGCDVVVDYTDENYFLIDSTNADYKEVFEKNDFQVCINCSGAASVGDSIHNPRRDFELNTLNVFKMLDAIRQFRPDCRFIQLSSAAVYGNPSGLPVKEDSALRPVSPYGWHKYYSELVCHEFTSLYKCKLAILRPFSVYGAGLKKQLFWDVYHKLGKGEKFELFGTGNETRDFIHISDMLVVIDLVMQKGKFEGEVYNVANGEAVRICDIIRDFAALSGIGTGYSFNNHTKEGDPLYWQADISRISALGYNRKVSQSDGLNGYIQWVKENG